MKYKKYISVLLAVLCIVGVGYLYPFSFFKHSDHDSIKGSTVLKQLAKRDFSEIDAQIRSIQEQYLIENMDPATFSSRLAGSIIMGDSLSEGLVEYNLLSPELVLAQRGLRTDNIDEEIQTAINYSPRNIFMQYGINDLTFCRGDAQRFVDQYSEQVTKLKTALPNTKIYINSLTPISAEVIAHNPNYGHVDDFNVALQTMCKKLQVVYIDNTKTIDFQGDVYEVDGIHPHYAYYSLWITKMIAMAGL